MEATKETKGRALSRKLSGLPSTEWPREFSRKSGIHEGESRVPPKAGFYSLYDKTYGMDVLAEAYRRVKANGGTSGVDGETYERIEEAGLTEYLAELQREMKERRYQPSRIAG